ncbi:MAG TPA: FAD-linked oxidase C-terminal domain-containing protein, partial [bacterium]|nr:FAD-linked oxidase C-terminal domain-containing protein [bacterium]
ELRRGDGFERDGLIPLGRLQVPLPSYRTPQIKCTAGYYAWPGMDAIDLIIGSEGTLSIITEVSVSLIEQLPERFIMVIFLPDDTRVLELVSLIKNDQKLTTYSLEYFCPGSLKFLQADFPEIPEGTFALYVEAESSESQLERWVELTERFGAVETFIGDDAKNYQRLIDFRHRLPENVNSFFRKLGIVKVAADIAVPEAAFPGQYRFYREIMAQEKMQTILFGHIGENHLHFNFFPRTPEEKERAYRLYRACAERAVSRGGTIAAEHGIGKIKHGWLQLMFGEKGVREMAAIKKMVDPACLLNLDNIFPRQLLSEV